MKKYIRTLTIYYDTEISGYEIHLFRGAIIDAMGDKVNDLFHNHIGNDKFRYSYPLIQYKRINGKAVIVCVDKGVDTIGQFISKYDSPIRLKDRTVRLKINKVIPSRVLIQTWENPFTYYIRSWLPLNRNNYSVFQQINDKKERINFLSNILKANILSMLKGLDIILEQEVKLEITWLSDYKVMRYKELLLTSFNAIFQCNVSLPNNIGLGKNTSLGFGTVFKKMEKDNQNPETENEINEE